MKASDLPARFPEFFGKNAPGGNIRVIPTTTVDPNAASLDQAFPTNTLTPIAAGGSPPDGRDVNGILRQITQWSQWQNAGGAVPYDATFSAAIGGYPKGAVVASAQFGFFWISTADDNATNPDAAGAGWVAFALLGGATTGSWTWRADGVALPGWVKADGTTIGNAASNATQRADADTFWLFKWHWDNFSNTQCPVFTSAGVASTRGATALDDFNANKRIQVLDLLGTGIMGLAGASGRLAGVPIVSGGVNTPGSLVGENLHALTEPQLPTIIPTGTIPQGNQVPTSAGVFSGAGGGVPNVVQTTNLSNLTFSGTAFGGNQSHNTVERAMLGAHYLKL